MTPAQIDAARAALMRIIIELRRMPKRPGYRKLCPTIRRYLDEATASLCLAEALLEPVKAIPLTAADATPPI